MKKRPLLAFGISLPLMALLGACTVGPDYKRPQAIVPASYKEANGWKPAVPQMPTSAAWWSIYHDPALDALERQVAISNQTIKAAEAAYRNAQAIVGESRAGYFPTLDLGGSATRSGSGAGNSSTGSRSSSRGGIVQNSFDVSALASWVPDIWGSVRRTVESSVAKAQLSAADLAAARLSAQATLAVDYFELRIADENKRLLDATVEAYGKSLQIAQNRYNVGTAARSDVVSAQAQLENTRAQAIATGVQRAQLEHAIAVLVGKAPGDFAIPTAPHEHTVLLVPPGVPSTLLERNPTIAAAERTMAAANAEIGIAEAGYFPTVTLGASYGQSSSMLHTLFTAASSLWSFGIANVNLPIFNGGLTASRVEAARATYDQSVANYRQTVLTAFQQVEDQLSASRILAQQADVQARAVAAAQEAERLTLNQYRAGTVDYTSVVTAQAPSLASQETALGVLQNRLLASVGLIEALGGGWEARDLPSVDAVENPRASDASSHGEVGSK